MDTVTLDFQSIELTDEQFYQLCLNNRDLRFERNANGDLLIMSPTGGETGNLNAGIIAQLWIWNDRYQLGKVFDSSTGFKLPNGADRSPDASWISLAQWNCLTSQQKQKFLPLAPDFVVELLSPSDRLEKTQEKMQEYIDNGTRLGWLVNPKNRQVEVYRQGKEMEILNSPNNLLGEDVLPEFVLNLESIW